MKRKLKLDDIIEVIELTSPLSHAFLDDLTGEIVWRHELFDDEDEQKKLDLLDEHGFIPFYRSDELWDLEHINKMTTREIAEEWCFDNDIDYT